MRHQINGNIVIDGKRRGDWTAMRRDLATSDFTDYHCIITYNDDEGHPMFTEFIIRGVGENAHPVSIASRVMGEGFHKLQYVNQGKVSDD